MDALRRFHAGELRGPAFLRALLAHPTWWVPAADGPDGPTFATRVGSDGAPWLAVFGSEASWRASGAERCLEVPTRVWVGALGPDLGGVDVEPGTPDAVHYRREQFGLLREWSRALDVEAILARDPTVPRPWHTLRSHVGWRILVRGEGEARQLVLAPDSRGRKLVAVFTAADAAEAFLARLGDPEVRVEVRPGLALFLDLTRVSADGLLFDPAGPEAPVAMGHAFVEAVLDGVDPIAVPSVLPARTRAEAELYLDVLGCGPERPGRTDTRGDDLLWTVDCVVAGRPQRIVFSVGEEPATTGFGGPGPSKILDPAAFLLHGDALAQQAAAGATDAVGRRVRAVRLDRAVRCLEEVLKFVPPHATQVPLDSFFSSAGRRLGRLEAERFSRRGLTERLDALRKERAAATR